jgi:hypothetical protein
MPKFTGCGKADRTTLHGMDTKEHDKIVSRTRGVKLEIAVGPHGASQRDGEYGGLVSNNPFASLAQEGFLHAHPEKLGKKGLAEWDAATKGKKLPKHVK